MWHLPDKGLETATNTQLLIFLPFDPVSVGLLTLKCSKSFPFSFPIIIMNHMCSYPPCGFPFIIMILMDSHPLHIPLQSPDLCHVDVTLFSSIWTLILLTEVK